MTLHAVFMVKTCKSTNSTIPDCQKFTYNLGFVCLIEIAASFMKWGCQAGMQEKKTVQRVVMQKKDAYYFFNWQSFMLRKYQCCRHFKTIEFLIKIIDRILNYRKNFRYKNLSNFILIATSTPENCFYIQPPTHQPWIILCLPQKLLWWYLIH